MKNGWRILGVVMALAVSACGGGGDSAGSSRPPNTAPTANFAFTCRDLLCDFTSTSTDQDVGDAIAGYSWSFGDATPADTRANPSHSYVTGSAFDVSLTVTDRSGATNTVTRRITVTSPANPAAPHAAFTSACVSLDCTFTDTSSYDVGSVFQSRVWDFGDAATLAATSPATHRYAATALTTYTVKLTITDAAGKTSTSAQTIVVAPPANTASLVLTSAAKVTATILSRSCAATGNRVDITAPITETVFADGCVAATNVPVTINGGATFAAGTALQVSVLSGTLRSSSLAFAPTIRVTGDFASGWRLTFDDGYGGPGEPDFDDLVILIKATP
jgi:PKD repeat protein